MRRRREFIVLIMVNKADRESDNCWEPLPLYTGTKKIHVQVPVCI